SLAGRARHRHADAGSGRAGIVRGADGTVVARTVDAVVPTCTAAVAVIGRAGVRVVGAGSAVRLEAAGGRAAVAVGGVAVVALLGAAEVAVAADGRWLAGSVGTDGRRITQPLATVLDPRRSPDGERRSACPDRPEHDQLTAHVDRSPHDDQSLEVHVS